MMTGQKFVLRNLDVGVSGLFSGDKVVFFREVDFDANGEAVIIDLPIKPGSTVYYKPLYSTTVCSAADASANALDIPKGGVYAPLAAETIGSPGYITVRIPAASATIVIEFIVEAEDLL